MAVLRDSQQLGPVGGANQPQVLAQRAAGVRSPDPREFLKPQSSADRILDTVLKVGSQLASTALETSLEEAYINGVRQAGELESEAELQTNSFTKDWTTAGFRDTKGRMDHAQFMASIPDMIQASLSEPDPKKAFSDKLAAEQAKLTGQFDGMSRKQRAAMFAQTITDTQTAQTAFSGAYTKHVIDTEEKSLRASFTALSLNMERAKGDPAAYDAASTSYVANVYSQVWLNDKLPEANKVALTKQAIEYAASTNNVQVYNMLKELEFDFPDGTKGSVMQKVPLDDQIELDTAYRSAMKRVKDLRALSFEDAMAQQEANDFEGMTYEQLRGQLEEAVQSELISASRYGSIMQAFWTKKGQEPDADLASMALAGDFPSIVRAGASERDAVKALYTTMEGRDYREVAQAMMNVCNLGMGEFCGEAGKLMEPAISNLGFAPEVTPESAQMVHGFIQQLDQAYGKNPGTYQKMLGALKPESQEMILAMRDAQTEAGIVDPLVAVEWARRRKERNSSPGAVAQRERNTRADAKVVQELDARQYLGTISSSFKFWSEDAAAAKKLRPFREWFESEDRMAEIVAASQLEVDSEFQDINRSSPFLSDESRKSLAMGRAAARAVDTPSGPVFVPKGNTMHGYFKAPQAADKALFERAFESLIPLEDGQRAEYQSALSDGAPMLVLIKDEEGRTANTMRLDPASVGQRVEEILREDGVKASQLTGAGKVVSRGTAKVQYNGQNTAGFKAPDMMLLRDTLVELEGVMVTEYADDAVVEGNRAFGVGISQTGAHFEPPTGPRGTYTQAQIDRTFKAASNEAAENAAKAMKSIGVTGPEWLKFFGAVSYQSPASARNADFLAYVQLGEKAQAVEAFKQTNAYKNSKEPRREWYIKQLNKAF